MVNISPKLEPEEKILLELARSKKSKTHYTLWKKDKVAASNKTVLTALSQLEKEGLVRSKQEKTGRKRKFYSLTLNGLVHTLENIKHAWRYIDEIAEVRKGIFRDIDSGSLIFSKWDFYKQKGLKNFVIVALKKAIRYYGFVDVSDREIRIIRERMEKEEAEYLLWNYKRAIGDVTNNVFFYLLFPLIYYDPKQHDQTNTVRIEKAILRRLSEDSQIREYVHKQISFQRKSVEEEYSNVRAWEEWFENINKSR